MKRPRRRYHDEAQILGDIDRWKKQAAEECARAERLDKQADVEFQALALLDYEKLGQAQQLQFDERSGAAKIARDEAAKLRYHQGTIQTKLGNLKLKLQEFRTDPILDIDKSIPA